MDGSVSDVCFRRAAGVCARQLCVPFRLVAEKSIKLPTTLFMGVFVIHLVYCVLKVQKTADSPPSSLDSLFIIKFSLSSFICHIKCRPHRFLSSPRTGIIGDSGKTRKKKKQIEIPHRRRVKRDGKKNSCDRPHFLYLQTFLR
jgi:hypothetical protein